MILPAHLYELGHAAAFGPDEKLCVAFADALQEAGCVDVIAGEMSEPGGVPREIAYLLFGNSRRVALRYDRDGTATCVCTSCERPAGMKDRCCTSAYASQRWARAALAMLLFGDLRRDWPVADRAYIPNGEYVETIGTPNLVLEHRTEGAVSLRLVTAIRMFSLSMRSSAFVLEEVFLDNEPIAFDAVVGTRTFPILFHLHGRRAYPGSRLVLRVRNEARSGSHTAQFMLTGHVPR